ncbi:MAG: VOC family protein [Pyrinomonadaceae bacterium]
MKRATGIGGVFFKAKDPKALAAWYEKHLGVPFGGNVYASFIWDKAGGMTVFSVFPEDTDYYEPSKKPFMFNFRVEDLHQLLATLKEEGVEVIDKTEEYPYGKFGWIVDPEGNKIELWEPIDSGFDE